MYRFLWLICLLLVSSMTFAQESEESSEIRLEISLNKFAFTLAGQEANAPIMLESGQKYALIFKNADTIDHEILWGQSFMTNAEGAHEDYETNLFATVENIVEGQGWAVVSPGLIELEIAKGQTLEVKFTIPDGLTGEWEMGCFLPGHHESGMHTPIIIQ